MTVNDHGWNQILKIKSTIVTTVLGNLSEKR